MNEKMSNIDRLVNHVKTALEQSDLSLAYGILFGSHARGDATEMSDVDIILVSPEFSDVPGHRRSAPILKKWDHGQCGAVDIICYTPSEYHDLRTDDERTLPDQALAEGLAFFKLDAHKIASHRSSSLKEDQDTSSIVETDDSWVVASPENRRRKFPSKDDISESISAMDRAFSAYKTALDIDEA